MAVQAEILPDHISPDFRNAGHLTAFFDMDAVSFPLTIRRVEPGDRFRPLGMAGTQKVKKFFIDHKIPAAERRRCPVLTSEGKLIWLVGYRMDGSVKITPTTRKVLRVEFRLV
jgi:tRNA(Ile)-lysidine synthase